MDLAKSVIRWVRRDRKEAQVDGMPSPLANIWKQSETCQVEWQARMAKYHSDKAKYL